MKEKEEEEKGDGGKPEVGVLGLIFLEYSGSDLRCTANPTTPALVCVLSMADAAPCTPDPRWNPPACSGSLRPVMPVVPCLCGKWILFHYGNKLLLPSE